MFYYVKGQLAVLENGFAVIDCGGVGYRLTVSSRTAERLSSLRDSGAEARLYTHLSVREDGIELFGFFDTEELDAFRLLTGVSGVGPRAAMSILSAMSPSRLSTAVATDDRKLIGRAPGIGPKTAARIVLELKDKIGCIAADETDGADAAGTQTSAADQGQLSAAVDALTVLGFTRSDAAAALRGIDVRTLSLEDVIREALKKLMK